MTGEPNSRKRILDAAIRLAAERGWRDLGFAEIAVAAGVPLTQVYRVLPERSAILPAIMRSVDEAVLASSGGEFSDEPRRDRVFDLLMRRFDALQSYKAGLGAIIRDLPGDPFSLLAAGPGLLRAMTWILEAAGVSTAGIRGAVRVKALALVYLATFRVWLRDDQPDLSRTMATLDRTLKRMSRLL